MAMKSGTDISRALCRTVIALSLAAALGTAAATPALADGHGGWHDHGGGWHGTWRRGGDWHGGWGGWRHDWNGGWHAGRGRGYYAPGYYWNGYSPSYVYAPPPAIYPPAYGYGAW